MKSVLHPATEAREPSGSDFGGDQKLLKAWKLDQNKVSVRGFGHAVPGSSPHLDFGQFLQDHSEEADFFFGLETEVVEERRSSRQRDSHPLSSLTAVIELVSACRSTSNLAELQT
ncbi:hypothetical protein AGIG_G6664 [Arapaima gigas]